MSGFIADHPLLVLAAAVVVVVYGKYRWNRLANRLRSAWATGGATRRSASARTVNRWGRRARHKSGVASRWDVLRTGSALALRPTLGVVRPTDGRLPLGARVVDWARVRAVEYAVPLCRVGWWRVWASIEDVILLFGGPRTGKSGWLVGRILDAPGAVLATSTRLDLYETTAPARRRRGPVFVFNPVGLADVPSSITFDPLTGCTDPTGAAERAADMISAVTRGDAGGDREFWASQARRVLAALMHAAALGDLSMHQVLGWIADPGNEKGQVARLLRSSPIRESAEKDVAQFFGTNDRTQTSITSTIMPALGWMTSASASAAAAPDRTPFDVTHLLDAKATVYLLGGEEAQTAPLVAALTGHIARQARRLAANAPGGRLDPPLTLVLDEAALICPVPLDAWTADMGGRGVTIITAVQSRAQLVARWGETGAAVILNNAGAVLLFGGTKDHTDLQLWTTLAGERDEPVESFDHDGHVVNHTTRKAPVLSGAQLATLPKRRVVLFRRGMPVAVGRVRMAWNRHDVRAAARVQRRYQAAVVAAAERARRAGGATPAHGEAQVPHQSTAPVVERTHVPADTDAQDRDEH